MQKPLMAYQTEAVNKILVMLARSKKDWHEYGDRTAFALSSTTGSGKTVIAAAVIEALLHGSGEFDVEPDSTSVVLWVSKDPSLNAQTRGRFIEWADRIPTGDLVLLDKTYAEDSLQTGPVYFINPDKLRDGADFAKHTDSRHVTFWEILDNTIRDPKKTLYLVLDEAHQGMRPPSDSEQTIVQRIINGSGDNPAVPVVWGITATSRRFNDAMVKAEGRTKRPNIEISPVDVQESGLLKNSITLDIPDEEGEFTTTLLRDATVDFVDVCERWQKYAVQEALENPVVPLLVVQIPNRADGEKDSEKGRQDEDDLIHLVLETIRRHWPDLPADAVAHVIGQRAAIEVGAYEIPKVAPQDVQHDTRIRVLIAKDAISTGWDCPRAEVLVSLRPGSDHTYVTQLLGRMVRTPLAQTTSEDRLNSASCYLPKVDINMATAIAEEIMGLREPSSGLPAAAVAKVMLKPVMLHHNDDVPDDVVRLLKSLPSMAKPVATPRPIKRLLKASQAFAQDGLVPGADKTAHETLFGVLDAIAARRADAIRTEVVDILTAEIRRIRAERGGDNISGERTQRAADSATVEDALRHLRRLISTSVVNKYLSREMQGAINRAVENGEDPSLVDIIGIRAGVAALGLISTRDGEKGVQESVEDAADALVRHWLTANSKAIGDLPDSRQPTYDAIRDMAREPEPVPIEIKTEELVDTVDTKRVPLKTARLQVLSDPEGDYPMPFNRWERAAVLHEIAGDSVVGWYRNPSAAGQHSLRIAYRAGDAWRSVQPDIIVVTKDAAGNLRPSIIDPHSAHQGDTSPKVRALAEYADKYGDEFDRIIFCGIEKDNALYGIDLRDSAIRRAVYECPADTNSLTKLFERHGKKYCTIPANV